MGISRIPTLHVGMYLPETSEVHLHVSLYERHTGGGKHVIHIQYMIACT